MRDYNFFEAFYEEKKSTSLRFVYVGAISAAIVGAMVISYLYTVFQISFLQQDVLDKQKTLNTGELKTAAQKLDIAQKKLNLLNNYYDATEAVNKITINTDMINTSLIKNISNEVPKEISFQVMNISDNVTIQGTAGNRTSIAEMEYNLINCGIFKDVHVSNITGSEEGNEYTFNIICTVKEETSSEEN